MRIINVKIIVDWEGYDDESDESIIGEILSDTDKDYKFEIVRDTRETQLENYKSICYKY